MAEQMSCVKLGSVISADRTPPPIVGSASSTSTESFSCASRTAAASPFGPDPTMTASYEDWLGIRLEYGGLTTGGATSPLCSSPQTFKLSKDFSTGLGPWLKFSEKEAIALPGFHSSPSLAVSLVFGALFMPFIFRLI